MASRTIRVGLIGCGFMGRTHSNAYRRLHNFFPEEHQPVLKAICDVNRQKADQWVDIWGYERAESDWHALMDAKDIDLIDICVPNFAHKEIAVAAAQAGKMIICEKPLAMNAAEGEEMCRAVEAAKVPNMISFNYRRVPSITLAKQIIDEGRIGRPFHYRATYLQDWTISADVPQGGDALWRLDAKVAGSGVTGDLPPWQIVRERRATFEATPEQNALRPGTATGWKNLFLAGDWTDTGLPATIEGSVRSGNRAADLVLAMRQA